MKPTIYMLIVGVCIFFAGAGWEHQHHTCVAPEPQAKLMSVMDNQRLLVERGYDIEIDGEPGPLTKKAFAEAYGNQCSAAVWPEGKP